METRIIDQTDSEVDREMSDAQSPLTLVDTLVLIFGFMEIKNYFNISLVNKLFSECANREIKKKLSKLSDRQLSAYKALPMPLMIVMYSELASQDRHVIEALDIINMSTDERLTVLFGDNQRVRNPDYLKERYSTTVVIILIKLGLIDCQTIINLLNSHDNIPICNEYLVWLIYEGYFFAHDLVNYEQYFLKNNIVFLTSVNFFKLVQSGLISFDQFKTFMNKSIHWLHGFDFKFVNDHEVLEALKENIVTIQDVIDASNNLSNLNYRFVLTPYGIRLIRAGILKLTNFGSIRYSALVDICTEYGVRFVIEGKISIDSIQRSCASVTFNYSPYKMLLTETGYKLCVEGYINPDLFLNTVCGDMLCSESSYSAFKDGLITQNMFILKPDDKRKGDTSSGSYRVMREVAKNNYEIVRRGYLNIKQILAISDNEGYNGFLPSEKSYDVFDEGLIDLTKYSSENIQPVVHLLKISYLFTGEKFKSMLRRRIITQDILLMLSHDEIHCFQNYRFCDFIIATPMIFQLKNFKFFFTLNWLTMVDWVRSHYIIKLPGFYVAISKEIVSVSDLLKFEYPNIDENSITMKLLISDKGLAAIAENLLTLDVFHESASLESRSRDNTASLLLPKLLNPLGLYLLRNKYIKASASIDINIFDLCEGLTIINIDYAFKNYLIDITSIQPGGVLYRQSSEACCRHIAKLINTHSPLKSNPSSTHSYRESRHTLFADNKSAGSSGVDFKIEGQEYSSDTKLFIRDFSKQRAIPDRQKSKSKSDSGQCSIL